MHSFSREALASALCSAILLSSAIPPVRAGAAVLTATAAVPAALDARILRSPHGQAGFVGTIVRGRRGPANDAFARALRVPISSAAGTSTLDALSQYIKKLSGPGPHGEIQMSAGSGPVIDRGKLPTVNPGYAPVYPGMLAHGSPKLLQAGQVVPLGIAGGRGSITVDAQFDGGSPTRSVAVDDDATVTKAMSSLMSQSFSSDELGQSFQCNAHRIYSEDDAKWTVNASASYTTFSASDNFSSSSSKSSNTAMLYCTHSYFIAAYTPNPVDNLSLFSAYFNPSTSVGELQSALGSDDPPVVVNTVTYGSQLMILFNSQRSADTMANELNLAYHGIGASASGSVGTQLQHDLSDVTCEIFANGGRASAVIAATRTGCNAGNVFTAIQDYTKGEADIAAGNGSAQAVAFPIGYTLSYLDGFPATIDANVYGPQKNLSTTYLTSATVRFHENGDGKDGDTPVDMYLVNSLGKNVATLSLGQNTPLADNGDSPVYSFKFVDDPAKNEVLRSDLNGGVFRMIVHPNGHDTWHYTAHLAFTYEDGSKDVGQADNTISQDDPERGQSLSDYITSFDRSKLSDLIK